MALSSDVLRRLRYFFKSYERRVRFLRDLAAERDAASEIILLVCCYIDQLGGSLFTKGASKQSFEQMILTHSGESATFRLISVPELARDFAEMAGLSFITVIKPGRLQLPREDLKAMLRLLAQSDVPLTERAVDKLFTCLYEAVKHAFRVHPHQTKRKPTYASLDRVVESIVHHPAMKKSGAQLSAETLKPIVREYSYSSILYREYRCKAVHEAEGIYIDGRRFWSVTRPYFVTLYPVWAENGFFAVEFPCTFLIKCLETCVQSMEKAIVGRGTLPLPIWNVLCEWDESEFLDVDSLDDMRAIGLSI